MLWFSDLVEPVENFAPFFSNPMHKILDNRNVWLLNYRNMGDSDHHESFAMEEISDDIARFMNQQKLTMATLGGHGFGAKVALATAINNMDRCTGVINLDGGPLSHQYYEAYQELHQYVDTAKSLDTANTDLPAAKKYIDNNVQCKKWKAIFMQNLEAKGDGVSWKFNVDMLAADMKT